VHAGAPALFQGLRELKPPTLFGVQWRDPVPFYALTLACALAAYFLVAYVVRSPFGIALQGIRANPRRMGALGFAVVSPPVGAFGLSPIRQKAIAGLYSNSGDAFSEPTPPPMNLVITVCDRAAAEPCPVWPGHPLTARWNVADPALVTGGPDAVRRAFTQTMQVLQQRISLLLALRAEAIERLTHIDASQRDALGIVS